MTVSCFLKKVARRSWSRQYFDGVWGARRRGLDSTPLFPVHEFVGFRSMAWRVCEGEHFACLSVSFFFFPTLTPVYSRNTARPAAVSPLYDTTFHFSTALNTCSRCSSARRLYFGFVVRTYSFALPHLPRNADDVGHMYPMLRSVPATTPSTAMLPVPRRAHRERDEDQVGPLSRVFMHDPRARRVSPVTSHCARRDSLASGRLACSVVFWPIAWRV